MELYGYQFVRESDLKHHGILGQRWGKKNGPPYPLDAKDHSASEQKAGWRKSLDKSSTKGFKLTPRQKKAAIIGASIVAAGLVGYGLYKTGTLNNLGDYVNNGKRQGNFIVGSIPDKYKDIPELKESETLRDSLLSVNPNRGNPDYDNNCAICSIGGYLRNRLGLNITAGKAPNGALAGGLVEELFPGIQNMKAEANGILRPRTLEGSAISFGKSKEDAAKMLVKRFGNNAEGICAIAWKQNGFGDVADGHAFSWKIEDGKVTFIDYQIRRAGKDLDVLNYWNYIDPHGYLYLARLDGLEPDYNAIKKYYEY